MFPIFKYAKAICKVAMYIGVYYLALVGGIYIIGFSNIGTEPIEDIYRIGSSIIASQPPWLLLLNFMILAVMFNFFVKEKTNNMDWYSFTGVGVPNFIGLVVLALILNIAISVIVTNIFPNTSSNTVDTIKNMGELYPFVLFINLGIVSPIVEELLFRFLIYNNLECFGTAIATVVSSVLFGIMHGDIIQTLYAMCFGIIFCMANKSHKSMMPSIIMHCTINSFTVYNTILTGGL